MKQKNRLPFWFPLWLALLGATPATHAQQLWPGDVNNNGIVNAVDLLWLGLAYNAEGPERPNATTLWQAQPLGAPWAQNFPGGLNYAYADCDGDGEVDDDDLNDAIDSNFRLTHGTVQPDGYANATPGSNNPRLRFTPSTLNAVPGQVITVEVDLGDAGQPVPSFYGIAFTTAYSAELVDNGGQAITFDDDDDWMAPEPDEPFEHLFKRDIPAGETEIGLVRTNQIPVSNGFGHIGSFSIIIEDIIVGLTIDTFILQIDSVRLIDHTNAVYPVVPDTVMVIVSNPMSTQNGEIQTTPVHLYPSPARAGQTTWVSTRQGWTPVGITDALGRAASATIQRQSDSRWGIHWPANMPAGWYALQCAGPNGALVTQTIILH
ncbi:MAG: hypothetical protein SFV52_05030 [Saprospiraceae bacterium]|nr:hypothetical protein [Saprospiraceae bacterium]